LTVDYVRILPPVFPLGTGIYAEWGLLSPLLTSSFSCILPATPHWRNTHAPNVNSYVQITGCCSRRNKKGILEIEVENIMFGGGMSSTSSTTEPTMPVKWRKYGTRSSKSSSYSSHILFHSNGFSFSANPTPHHSLPQVVANRLLRLLKSIQVPFLYQICHCIFLATLLIKFCPLATMILNRWHKRQRTWMKPKKSPMKVVKCL
jgi:hypothetical protein